MGASSGRNYACFYGVFSPDRQGREGLEEGPQGEADRRLLLIKLEVISPLEGRKARRRDVLDGYASEASFLPEEIRRTDEQKKGLLKRVIRKTSYLNQFSWGIERRGGRDGLKDAGICRTVSNSSLGDKGYGSGGGALAPDSVWLRRGRKISESARWHRLPAKAGIWRNSSEIAVCIRRGRSH